MSALRCAGPGCTPSGKSHFHPHPDSCHQPVTASAPRRPLQATLNLPNILEPLLLTLRISKWRRMYSAPLYVNIQNKKAPLLFAFISKENIHAKYCECNFASTTFNLNPPLCVHNKVDISISSCSSFECTLYLNAYPLSRSGSGQGGAVSLPRRVKGGVIET